MSGVIIRLILLLNCACVRCARGPLLRAGPLMEHRFMPGPVYFTVRGTGIHMCAELCKFTYRCRSFNFDRGHLLCHFLVFESHPDKLIYSKDVVNSNIQAWEHVNQGLCEAAECSGSARCILGTRGGQQYAVCKNREEIFTPTQHCATLPLRMVKLAMSGKYSDRFYGLESKAYNLVIVHGKQHHVIPIQGKKPRRSSGLLDLFTGPCPNPALPCIYLLEDNGKASQNRILVVREPTSENIKTLQYDWHFALTQSVNFPQAFVMTPELDALVFTRPSNGFSALHHFRSKAVTRPNSTCDFVFIRTLSVYTGKGQSLQADLSSNGRELLTCAAKHKLIYSKLSRSVNQLNIVIEEAVSLEKVVKLTGSLAVGWSKTEAKFFLANSSQIHVSYLKVSPVHADSPLSLKADKFTSIVTSRAYPHRLYLVLGHVDVIKVYNTTTEKQLGILHVDITHKGEVTLETSGPCTQGRKTCLYFSVRVSFKAFVIETMEEPSILNVTLESRGSFRIKKDLIGMAVFPDGKLLLLLNLRGYIMVASVHKQKVKEISRTSWRITSYPQKVAISEDGKEVVFLTLVNMIYFRDCGYRFQIPTAVINLHLKHGGKFVAWYGDGSFLLSTTDEHRRDVIIRYVTHYVGIL